MTNRSAAVKKAWITRKMKRTNRLGTGELMHGAAPKYAPTWKQVSTRLGRAVLGKPKMTAKAWDKAFSSGQVMMNGRPMRDYFTTRGTRRK